MAVISTPAGTITSDVNGTNATSATSDKSYSSLRKLPHAVSYQAICCSEMVKTLLVECYDNVTMLELSRLDVSYRRLLIS